MSRSRLSAVHVVILGVLLGMAWGYSVTVRTTETATMQDLGMDVWLLEDGARVQGFSFGWTPANPVEALTLQPLAITADKDRYGKGNPGIEVYLRGDVWIDRDSDLAENRVDVTADVSYVAADGSTGTSTASTALDETGWEDSSDYFSERFKFHWDPLISGKSLVCNSERGSHTVNLSAYARADAKGKSGPMWGEATTAVDVTYSCSKNDAGLSIVAYPAISITDGARTVRLAPTYLGSLTGAR